MTRNVVATPALQPTQPLFSHARRMWPTHFQAGRVVAAWMTICCMLPTATLAQSDSDGGAMTAPSKEQAESIRKAVEAALGPGSKVQSVFRTPYLGGLYEVRIGNSLLYTDAKVSYILSGSVFDGKTLENLTENRLARLTAIKFQELPLDLALKSVRGKGSRQLAVFEDPNCGYCKQFRKNLLQLDDVSIHTFIVPMLGPDSVSKTQQMLCASDKLKAWDDWMLRNKLPSTAADCGAVADKQIEKLQELGRRLAVSGTPTVIFADGTRATGAIPTAQLELRIAQAAASAAGNKR